MDLSTQIARDQFRWPVARSIDITAPAADVWRAISEPGNLVASHPLCKYNPVEVWDRENSLDAVHYLNGVVYARRFRDWHEGRGYDLEIFHGERRLAWVSWRIEALGDERASLKIAVYPLGLQHLKPIVRWAPHLVLLRPKMRAYLDSVLRGFEWSIIRGDAVPRNQFGAHRWFS
jgi:hypothetical protein